MAQSGFTPIQLYYSTTASATPSAGNLANGELAINITDGRLFYKDNGGTVRVLAGTGGSGVVAGSNTQVQFNNNGVFGASSGLTWDGTNLTASQLRSSGLTSGRVTYASTSGLLVDSANMTFNGTRLTVADLADSGLTATRVVYSTTGGALVDSANLTFDGTTLTANALTVSNAVTFSGGTANGVAYLNGSKVLTTGSALTFDGTNTFGVTSASATTIAIDSSGGSFLRGVSFRASGAEFGFDRANSATGEYRHSIGPSAGWGGFHTYYIDGSERMRLTSTGNLGIGTSSPGARLVVAGGSAYVTNTAGNAAGIELAGNGNGAASTSLFVGQGSDGLGYLFQRANLGLLFGTNNTERMRLDASGNLGLGVTPSAIGAGRYLQVLSVSSFGQQANGSTNVMCNAYESSANTFNYVGSFGAMRYNQSASGGHSWYTAPSGTADAAITFTQAMTLDASGNLGIGTSSPAARLSVRTTGAQVDVSTSGTQVNFEAIDRAATTNPVDMRFFARNGTFQWHNSSYTERMRLDASGNLGLGVTPSAWGGGNKAFEQIGGSLFSGSIGNIYLGNNLYYDGTNWLYKNTAAASYYQQGAGAHIWYRAASGTAGTTVTFTQAMTLDAAGNLGVGTSSPSVRLHAEVTNSTNAGAAVAILRQNGAGNNGVVIDVASTPSNYVADFRIANSSVTRIDSSGNLLVGTTSTNPSSGGLHLGNLSGLGGAGWGIIYSATSTSGSYAAYFKNPNGAVGSIITSGSSTAYNTSSDYRLKENIQPMTGALAKVAALKPCTYKWKADGSDGEGFIAHELAEVVPQCVTGEKDAVDADGNPVYQGIDTSFLVATLTAAIQEQQAIINQLKAEFEAYKATHP